MHAPGHCTDSPQFKSRVSEIYCRIHNLLRNVRIPIFQIRTFPRTARNTRGQSREIRPRPLRVDRDEIPIHMVVVLMWGNI